MSKDHIPKKAEQDSETTSESGSHRKSREDLAQHSLHRAAEILLHARRHQILLVEDTAAHAAIIRRALNASTWEIEHVTRAADAQKSFETNPYRIVLLDLSLPDSPGLQLLQRLRAINPQVPVIVCTSTDQVTVSVEAMQKGAWDYVVKGDPKETGERIIAAVDRAWNARLRLAENSLIEQTRLVELVRSERLEAIEVIVRTVCHEVNNPLSGVVALSQLLRQNDKLDGDLKRVADAIARSAQEVAEVVQKLKNIGDTVIEFGGREILDLEAEEPPPPTIIPDTK